MLYSIVLFDLDGTLIESGPGIFAAARAVLRDMDIPDRPDCDMVGMIGPPLADGFRDVLGVPEARIPEAVERYHEAAKTVGMDLIRPYPGVPELLESLDRAGALVGVVTSKITPTAKAHLERFGLAPRIRYVRGGFPGGSAEKSLLLREAIHDLRADKASIVMVGDRHFDLMAARDAGIASVGVTYGYGSESEIDFCNPTHKAASVAALRALLLREP